MNQFLQYELIIKIFVPPHRSVECVKGNTAKPSDVLRLLKQPDGVTRAAVQAANDMDNMLKLMRASVYKRDKRSINATGALARILHGNIPRPPHCVRSFNNPNEYFALSASVKTDLISKS